MNARPDRAIVFLRPNELTSRDLSPQPPPPTVLLIAGCAPPSGPHTAPPPCRKKLRTAAGAGRVEECEAFLAEGANIQATANFGEKYEPRPPCSSAIPIQRS